MTRKDYIWLAAMLVEEVPDQAQREAIVARFVPWLKRDNAYFSADRFAAACSTATTWGY